MRISDWSSDVCSSDLILLGMILGGSIFAMAGDTGPWVAGCAIVVLAVTGHLVSRAIPPAGAGAPGLKINWNPIPESIAVLKLARRQRSEAGRVGEEGVRTV